MHRLFILAAVFGLAVIAADAQVPADPQQSPKEVVEQFYKMETEGRWLGPERWDELQDFATEVSPWFPPTSISVLKSYEVGDARKDIGAGGNLDYQVEVDFFEWGSIDSFLNFTKARGLGGNSATPGGPVERRTYQTLVLRNTFLKETPSGEEKEEKGTFGWRMALFAPPSVDVSAAIRWISEMRDKTSDPAIKYNAEKTLVILKGLSVGGPVPTQPTGIAKMSPSETAQRFVSLESDLLPDQWSQLAEFFAETPKPLWNRVHVVDVVRTSVGTNEDSAEVEVSTNSLGELDESLRLWNYPQWRLPPNNPGASACYGDHRFAFSLLLSGKHWEIAPNGSVKEFDGPLAWRIEDTSFQPLITLKTAIRYVRQVREKTTDPVVKRNAASTLRILEYYKQGKPLPHGLSTGGKGGCG
jgi:hypothetical protein